MPSLVDLWTRIIEWFHDRRDRSSLILGFNKSAKDAFINGYAPVILEARISKGNKNYKHRFSSLFNTGFRIKAYSGFALSKNDTINIGNVILANQALVRRLVVLGFDTLEVHCDVGNQGCQWQLHDYIQIGQGE